MDPLKTDGESTSKEDWGFLGSNSRGKLTTSGLLDLEMAKRPELTFLFAMRPTGEPGKKNHGSTVSAVRSNTARGALPCLCSYRPRRNHAALVKLPEQEAFRW